MILSIYDIPCLELQYIPSWEASIQLFIPTLGTRNGPEWQIQMQIPSSPTGWRGLISKFWFDHLSCTVRDYSQQVANSHSAFYTVHRNLPRCLSPRKWEGKINVIIYLYCQKTHYKHTPQITKQSKDRERELNSNRETHVQFSAVYAPISVCSTNQHTYTLVWSYFLMKSAFF